MRKRDFHFVVAECVLTACALASCALAVCVSLHVHRRVAASLADVRERVDRAERMCADASAAAIAACEVVRDNASSVLSGASNSAPVPLRVRGYGQGRTPRSRYVYRDIELTDGTTDREYVAWLPLSPSVSE